MSKKNSKILFIVILALTFLSIVATSYRYLVIRDYEVYDDTEEELLEEVDELE
tara:strand:- start:57 stop:215 length:159 start_codon:yes stop_codon:yes gene_type:complete